MKLPIKKKWFDKIKSGEKTAEFRDAHITFICEETGETLRKEVVGCRVINKKDIYDKDAKELMEDDKVIIFNIRRKG